MRQLVLLVCVGVLLLVTGGTVTVEAGIIPSWEDPAGKVGFYPVSNEISYYKNVDDSGEDRGRTLQIVAINGFRLFTDFSFEFTADYNFDFTPGLNRDHYVELSLVKPITSFLSVNVQRVMSSFEPESVSQVGFRLVF